MVNEEIDFNSTEYIQSMSYSLFNASGSASLSAMAWTAMLITMQHHGWVPAGTVLERPPAPRLSNGQTECLEWSGSYASNDGQTVTDSDAASMAVALRSYNKVLDQFECILGEAGGRELHEMPIRAAMEALLAAEGRGNPIVFDFANDGVADDDRSVQVAPDSAGDIQTAFDMLEHAVAPIRARGDALDEYSDRGLGWLLLDSTPEARAVLEELRTVCEGGAFTIC
jgi:hypothetical protein